MVRESLDLLKQCNEEDSLEFDECNAMHSNSYCMSCMPTLQLELSLAFEDNSFPSGAFQTVELELSLCEITN